MTPIQKLCIRALKLRSTAATYVIKNTIKMEGWDKAITTPKVLRAMKSLEKMGFVEQLTGRHRIYSRQYEWRLL